MHQIEMVTLDSLIPQDHSYRKFCKIWSFDEVEKRLSKCEHSNSYKGFGILRLFKCLLPRFSQQNKRVRYCGIEKNQFSAFMEAICFNLKRLAVLDPPGLSLA